MDGNDFSRELEKHVSLDTLVVSANLENELLDLDDAFRQEMLASYGLMKSTIPRLLKVTQQLLGLETFYTAGEMEARAWFVPVSSKAPDAAAVIHSDFKKGFQGADVWNYQDIIAHGSKSAVKAAGLVKLRGKDYIVEDGSVIEFRIRNAK